MLGASPEEHILKEREGPSSLHNYLCGRDSCTNVQPRRLGSIRMAAGCGHATGPHGGHSQAVDLGPIMPVTQFRVTDKAGTYLCAAQALAFKGSVLAYNPARDEAEWVPTCTFTNDLTWAQEKSAVALVNYVPHVSQEAGRIARLGAHRLISWPDDSSTSGEEDEELEEDEEQEEEEEHKEREEWEEVGPEPPSTSMELKQGEGEGELEPSRR